MSGFEYQRLIVGYHGCDRSVVERVLLDGTPLRRSENAYDWLGHGVYFWEHGPDRAMDWARHRSARNPHLITEPAVLGALIHLGRCFDLTDVRATRQLKRWYEMLRDDLSATGEPLPQNEPGHTGDDDLLKRVLDCSVVNYAMRKTDREVGWPRYQTVRGVFQEGKPAYAGSKILEKTHVQVVVRDATCILGYFRPTFPTLSQSTRSTA